MPRSHRTYNRISSTHDTDDDHVSSNSPRNEPYDDNETTTLPPTIHNEINITLLDGAQTKFSIAADPKWKVSQFKIASSIVTKVPPESQRLIHMGKLLMDTHTLEESGIDQSDVIVHLFPKPNVVMIHTADEETSTSLPDINDHSEGGAHIPQIRVDAEEAARRSQILILSSQEIFEAQHRVKIFCFLLMILTSMELLTLITLYLGEVDDDEYSPSIETPPGNPTDTVPHSTGATIRTWQDSDYADALISGFGFYVSLLGIKATTENTVQLARWYFVCLVIAGIANNVYYYYLNVTQMVKNSEERNQNLDDASLYGGSFVGILVPLTVWCMCILRAYQFHFLIREAEREAQERSSSSSVESALHTASSNNDNRYDRGVLPYGSGENSPVTSSSTNNDLELQVEQGVST